MRNFYVGIVPEGEEPLDNEAKPLTCDNCGSFDDFIKEKDYTTSPDGRSFFTGYVIKCGACGNELEII